MKICGVIYLSKYCTKCGKSVNGNNKFCNNCGKRLGNNKLSMNNSVNVNERVIADKNPWLAAFLSFFLLGFGQFYNGQVLKGIIFVLILFLLVALANIEQLIFLPVLFLLFFLYIVYDAYKSAKKINANDYYSYNKEGN